MATRWRPRGPTTARTTRRGALAACALLLGSLLTYEAVLLLVVPGAAQAAPSSPRPPAQLEPLKPVRGSVEQAALLAEDATGGVTVEVDAEDTKGWYEVYVVKGSVEIDLCVDVPTGRVVEIGRESAGR
jgi:hypothetical protein